jgi:hypothetical protein
MMFPKKVRFSLIVEMYVMYITTTLI